MRKGVWLGTVPGGLSDEGLALVASCGFEGVELPAMEDAGERKSAVDLVQKHGLVVSGVMTQSHWKYPLSDPSPQVRATSVQGLIDAIDTAVAADADTVLLVPAVVNRDVTYAEAWIRSQSEILSVVEHAAAAKVSIGIENVWNKFLLSPIEFAQYVDQFSSLYVGAYFDVGNICLYGYAEQWIRYLGSRIRRVHIKGFDSQARQFTSSLTGGDLDWGRAVAALDDIQYEGWITAEMPVAKENPRDGFIALSEEMNSIFGERFS